MTTAAAATTFTPIAEIVINPETALVHEHGWQSWSPTTTYRVGEGPHRPSSDRRRVMGYRPDRVAPADAYQGEGLLVVEPGDGSPAHRFAVADPRGPIPSIRAEVRGARVLVCSDGPVRHDVCAAGPDVALAGWADELARNGGVAPGGLRPAPTMWCSWYGYWQAISDRVILDNVAEIERLGLPVDVVQIDDGYQAEIGDWLQTSPTFGSLRDLTAELRARGRRVGVWTAPFLVGERSQVAKAHPEWLVDDIDLGRHWGQRLFALDVTHPHAAAHLVATFEGFRELGVDVFKVDFVYAGAIDGRRHQDLPGVAAYQAGLRLIREAIGPDAYLLGCGAPILPSVGLVDAMRISPDTGPEADPAGGDMSQPSSRAAILTGAGRAWQHGRFWVNDADCLLARPAVQEREAWAAHVERCGGLRGSSDRLADLDGWGLATTRRLLDQVPEPVPFATGPR